MIRRLITMSFLIAAAAMPAAAQDNQSVAAFRDWSVFNPSDPRECYVVTPPTATEARRGGSTVSVRRGDILFFVTIRPADGVNKEVSFTGGYPFREGSTVELRIGDNTFALTPGGGSSQEWAWPPSPERDQEIVAAMRAGTTAVVTAISQRGTTTIDSFSLLGFTAALDEAERLCS